MKQETVFHVLKSIWLFKNAVNNLNLFSNEDLLLSTTHPSDPVQIAIEKYKNHPSILTIQNNVTIDESFLSKWLLLIPYINRSTNSNRKRMARMVEFPPNV